LQKAWYPQVRKLWELFPSKKNYFVHLNYQDWHIGDSHNEDAPSKMLVTPRSIYEWTSNMFINLCQTIVMGQTMVGVLKRTVSFCIKWTPSLKTCYNLMAHSYWKFDFFHGFMHSMSNLNKFHDSYQVLKKILKLYFLRKKKFKNS